MKEIEELKRAHGLKEISESSREFLADLHARDSLEFSGEKLVFSPEYSGEVEPFTFKRATTETLLACDDSVGSVHKTVAMMGQLTGRSASDFSKLDQTDYKTCVRLMNIIMGPFLASPGEPKEVCPEEMAEAEFDRVCRARRLRTDPKKMSGDELKLFERGKAEFIASVVAGSITVDEDAQAVFTPQFSKATAFTFGPVTGGTFLAGDSAEGVYHRNVAMIASVTGQTKAAIRRLMLPDFMICKGVIELFLD